LAYAVKNEISYYQQKGVSGVPFFIINNKYGINGAQPSDVFLEVFETVSQPAEIISGDSCDPETGEC
ncbi:MAG TPA: DsbA family oxidoreductase, partial [Roseivirga sp.]